MGCMLYWDVCGCDVGCGMYAVGCMLCDVCGCDVTVGCRLCEYVALRDVC